MHPSLVHKKPMLFALTVVLPVCGLAQNAPHMSENAHPSFEVATIRPSDPNDDHQGVHLTGHRILIENQTLKSLVTSAFTIQKQQIVGAPAWFSTERFDIDGVSDIDGIPSDSQLQEMLQKLLANRFGLKVHRDKKEIPCYAVTVLKGGSKLVPSKKDPNGPPEQPARGHGNHMIIRFTNNTMADFAFGIQFYMDRPVVDQTDPPWKYDVTMEWTPDIAQVTESNAPPGVFTAIQEQLGLKLEPKKALVDVLVIDQIERPSAN